MRPPENITSIFIAEGPEHYGLLEDDPLALWKEISRAKKDWNKMTAAEKELHRRISGCLEKLSACLLQCRRLKEHHEWLITQAKQNAIDNLPPDINQISAAFSSSAAIADFEALVLQARAALDRLTLYLTSYFRNPSSRYTKLSNILENFVNRDVIAKQLIQIHQASEPWINGLLSAINSGQSFRSIIAHREAAMERMNSCFAINFMDSRHALLFDCELWGFGVFKTTIESAQHLSFLILNSLAVMSSHSTIPFSSFNIRWENKTILFADYVIEENEGSPLGPNAMRIAAKMIPGGMTVLAKNVKPEINNHIVFLDEC